MKYITSAIGKMKYELLKNNINQELKTREKYIAILKSVLLFSLKYIFFSILYFSNSIIK